MSKTHLLASLLAVVLCWTGAGCAPSGPNGEARETEPLPATDEKGIVAAAPGRIEGAQETLNLGIGMDGVIQQILVSAGDEVSAGQLLAAVDRDDLLHEERAASAGLERSRSRRLRLLRGARDETRQQAAEEMRAAVAVADEARIRFSRMDGLLRAGAAAAVERDEAKRDFDAADARLRAAEQAYLLARAGPLPEEIRQAEADIAEAQARVQLARARRDQGLIVAPYNATVLKIHLRAGESVTPLQSQAVMTIADLSRLRVRAEVDERDVHRVQIGQRVTVSVADIEVADGTVAWVAPVMGRKRTSTGEPWEKADRDVREVLIDLNGRPQLVIDQRVTAQFQSAQRQ